MRNPLLKMATHCGQETNPDGPVSFFEPVENPHSVQPLRASAEPDKPSATAMLWDRSSGHYQKFDSFVRTQGRLFGFGAVDEITDKVMKVLAGQDVRYDEVRRDVAALLNRIKLGRLHIPKSAAAHEAAIMCIAENAKKRSLGSATKTANGFDTPAGGGKVHYTGFYPEAVGGGWNPQKDNNNLRGEISEQLGGYAAGTRGAEKTQNYIDNLYRGTQEPPTKPEGKKPETGKWLNASKKPKCPYCGSSDYGLMPTDFETAKCNKCGKNWEHGIVKGINDPSDKTAVAPPRFTANLLQKLAKSILEELKNQKLDETVVQNILNTDPTQEKSYSLWLASQLKKKQIRLPEDSNQLKTQLQEFTKIKRSPTFTGAKDINKYSIGDLYEITQKKDVEVSKTQQVKELIEKGNANAKIVAKEGAFTLYEVTGAEEVTILGSNTNWCTTQLEAAEDNLSKGPIFIGYYQGNPYLQFNSEQCLNKKNEEVGDDKIAYTLIEMGFKHKIKATYSWVARNPNTPPASLSLLAKDADVNVRCSVAWNPNTPPASLALLAKEADGVVRRYVADNPNAPSDLLSLLAKDADEVVRYNVAENPNTPPASLALLAKDADGVVRYYVAENPNTPPASLSLLAKDAHVNVRQNVAENPNTPSASLSLLAKDTNAYVRYYVAQNPNTPPASLSLLAKDDDKGVRLKVAMNPNTPPASLALLAKEADGVVRRYVADNPNAPSDLLSLLAKDTDASVRQSVAKNPNTPSDLLSLLAKDEDRNVRCNVTQNPNAPPASLAKTSALATPPDLNYSESAEPGETLPEIDEIQYIYYEPVPEDEGSNDCYSIVGFKEGIGVFNSTVPSGRLSEMVGENLANEMALGKGTVVVAPDIVGDGNKWRSLVVHGKEFNDRDKAWLRSLRIKESSKTAAANPFLNVGSNPMPFRAKFLQPKLAWEGEMFSYVGTVFDINKAEQIIAANPREARIAPTAFLTQFVGKPDVVKEDGTHSMNFFDVGIDRKHLDNVDITKPGIVAALIFKPTKEYPEKGQGILIDGNHRAKKAINEGKEFKVYCLTPEETWEVMSKHTPAFLLKKYVNPTKKPTKLRVKPTKSQGEEN